MPAHTVETQHIYWNEEEGRGECVRIDGEEANRIQKIISVCLNNKLGWDVIADIVRVAIDLDGEETGIILRAIKAEWER